MGARRNTLCSCPSCSDAMVCAHNKPPFWTIPNLVEQYLTKLFQRKPKKKKKKNASYKIA